MDSSNEYSQAANKYSNNSSKDEVKHRRWQVTNSRPKMSEASHCIELMIDCFDVQAHISFQDPKRFINRTTLQASIAHTHIPFHFLLISITMHQQNPIPYATFPPFSCSRKLVARKECMFEG
jgi:hypothetical protein